MKMIQQVKYALTLLKELHRRLDKLEQAVGNIQTHLSAQLPSRSIQDHEFQVYSQSGEDGIIQFLIRQIPGIKPLFVEFGVERYTEANTRFLLTHDNWRGLIMDGSRDNIEYLLQDRIMWQHTLTAVQAFVKRENINALLADNGFTGEIGLLSVDIDGNDYWVWEAIDCVTPAIVVCEYNSLFGPSHKLTIPYQPDFMRGQAHYSNLYYGASIAALTDLANRKGYQLVGANQRGNNVFFIKTEYGHTLPNLTPEQAYVETRYREARTQAGGLAFLDFAQARRLIAAMPLYDIDKDRIVRMQELVDL
jgi:hypothetical protein